MPGTGGGRVFDGPNHGVEWRIMTGPIVGYLKIMTVEMGDAPLLVRSATNAVKMFKAMRVRGIVLDMRSNPGGDDEASASIVELFYTGEKSVPYPYADIKVATIKPNNTAFAGPLAVLVDHNCVSACEGISFALREYLGDRTRYFSYDSSTIGAFGLIDDMEVKMPCGLKVTELMKKDGKSMKGRKFLIEANDKGMGGVPANVVIPATLENLHKRFRDGADLPLEEAVKWIVGDPAPSPMPAPLLGVIV
jgi:carboxyl-terminal processing protease